MGLAAASSKAVGGRRLAGALESGDSLLASQSFPASQGFDRAGRVTADARSLTGISGDAGTGTQSFSHDALSRLTGSSGLAVSRSYQYDLDGNRTRRVEGSVTTDFTFDRADRLAIQTIGATTRSFDYDRYGNLLSAWDASNAQTTYAYDEANRLTTIAPPGGAGTRRFRRRLTQQGTVPGPFRD